MAMTPALPTISLVFVPTVVVTTVPAIVVSMPRLVFWHINIFIPLTLYEIDRPVTGIVFITILFPSFLMSGRNVQIERWRHHTHRQGDYHNGF